MGNHYIPKKYLRHFSDNEGKIWVYDKQEGKIFRPGVRVIANEIGMYSEKVEKDLNNLVEIPTHRVFEKIHSRRPLSTEDRHSLAKYMVVLWKRVPAARERFLKSFSVVADNYKQQITADIAAYIKVDPSSQYDLESFLVKAKAYVEILKADPPPDFWYKGFNLSEFAVSEEATLSMHWVFLCSEKHQFLTSDNPIFFFANEGLGRPQSELTFPISSSVALWVTRQPGRKVGYVMSTPKEVREINRRTAFNSTRFVFSKKNEDWIGPFTRKGNWRLTRLNGTRQH